MKSAALALALVSAALHAQVPDPTIVRDDLAKNFKAPAQTADYNKRVAMIPMRDGTRLYTVIVVPTAVTTAKTKAPILLTRTCYNAARPRRATQNARQRLSRLLRDMIEALAADR